MNSNSRDMIFKFHNKLQLLRKIAARHPLTPHTNKHTTNSHFTQTAALSHTQAKLYRTRTTMRNLFIAQTNFFFVVCSH